MARDEGVERFYYADGEKVPIATSRRFLAVRAAEPTAEAAAGAAAALRATPAAAAGEVLELPEYGLAVVALPENGAATASQAAVQSLVAASPGLEPGPVVYEVPDAPEGGAMIAVGEIIVKFRADASDDARRKLLSKHRLVELREDYPEPDAALVTTSNGKDAVDAANELEEKEGAIVEYAQPNFVVLAPRPAAGNGVGATLLPEVGTSLPPFPDLAGADQAWAAATGPAVVPGDPGFPSQWGLRKIRAPEAWDISMGSPAISIAIIDEGNDMAHEDIAYRTPGYDAYAGDNDPTPEPADAHGTACGGVAAAKANNGKGGAGVAPGCKIVGVRIAKGTGGGFWDTTHAKVADGIRTAVDRGADVLSNSYQLGQNTAVTNAFQYARTNGRGGKGCPAAAAAGNQDRQGIIYPARLSPTIPGLLAVGASNEWDQRKSRTSLDGENWWGSNYGPELDVVAPGVHVYTTDITGAAGYGGGNYVPNFNGTSSATPHVAGLMALILSVDPELRSWEVEEIVKLTADDLGAGGRDEMFGFGRIDCRRALEAASRLWYEVAVVPQFLGAGRECYLRARVRMFNPGINTVRLDALTLTSHNPSWTAEIDRFEYRPDPGNVLLPRSGDDVKLNGILLRANGTAAGWSYRWSLSWTYTFWRPVAPSLPLGAVEPPAPVEGAGRAEIASPIRGEGEGGSPAGMPEPAAIAGNAAQVYGPDGAGGDTIAIDRRTRAITVVVR